MTETAPPPSIQVWVLRNRDGSFRAKFHRHDSYDCPGRCMYENNFADKDDYVLVDLASLSPRHGACQFGCCFAGRPDARSVREHAAIPPTVAGVELTPLATPTGIRIGQRVVYRILPSGRPTLRRIIPAGASITNPGEIRAHAPIAQALLGRQAGEILEVIVPKGPVKIEILNVLDAA